MNEFWGLVGFHRWVRSPSGKSFRKVPVKIGMYVIIHRNTGQFFVGQSNDVSNEVDLIIQKLDSRKFKIEIFNRLMELDDQLEILEVPCTKKDYKLNIKTMEHHLPDHYDYLWRR